MKKKTKKRVTLASLLIKALCISAAVIIVFAINFRELLNVEVGRQARIQVNDDVQRFQSQINKLEAEYDEEDVIKLLDNRMNSFDAMAVDIEDPFTTDYIYLNPDSSENCHTAVVLIDENKNIVASDKKSLTSMVLFEKNSKNKAYYSCDREFINLPEVDKLYEDLYALEKHGYDYALKFVYDSIYVNKENFSFIPHKGKVSLIHYKDVYDIRDDNKEIVKTLDIDITVDKEGYELIELKNSEGMRSEDDYPTTSLNGFWGTEQEIIDSFEFLTMSDKITSNSVEYNALDGGLERYRSCSHIYINDSHYSLRVGFIVDLNDKALIGFYVKYTVIFSVLVLLVAMMYVWYKNTRNKAQYAMEDYQRELTNNLAHDIKTPLMAIGGYTENIMEGNLTENERRDYLAHILENISFADSLVNRTLQLNKIGETKPKKEKIKAEEIFERAMKKYAPLLDEKNIKYTVKGNCEVNAEPNSFEALVENLVSNAVKYTTENGEIKGIFDKKTITITNTVAEKIDTRDLKTPFVRGDKSRSNVKGSGLGLSIADKSAISNNMKLKLSCTDNEFKAEVRV